MFKKQSVRVPVLKDKTPGEHPDCERQIKVQIGNETVERKVMSGPQFFCDELNAADKLLVDLI